MLVGCLSSDRPVSSMSVRVMSSASTRFTVPRITSAGLHVDGCGVVERALIEVVADR